jgi:hypothetical protein
MKVNSNDARVNHAREATPGVLPAQPKWRDVEMNSAPSFGNDYKRSARSPMDGDRQRLKGTITDMDSPIELESDLTLTHFRDMVESFLYARAIGPASYQAGAATGTGITAPAALSASQAGQFKYGAGGAAVTLVHISGYATEANNGLKPISAAVATNATEIPVAGLTAEAAVPTKERVVAIAGVRGAAGDLEIDADGNLTSTVLDFTTLGLPVGASIHVGGVDAANRFFEAENFGLARIKAVAAHKITLDRRAQAFVADDGTVDNNGGAGARIDILFGQFVRNVRSNHPDYAEITNQFEAVWPGLGANGETLYEYATGCYADAMVVGLPLTEKASIKFGFTGLNSTEPSTVRATNAADASVGTHTVAFATAHDIARLRIFGVDEEGMATDFKSLTLNIKNNAQGEKVLGTLGPKYVNPGNFEIDIEFEAIFTDKQVVTTIRNNETVGIDFGLLNGDGCIYFDIPAGTLEGGKRNFKENESVTFNGTLMAHRDPVLGSSIGVTIFPILPTE